ncbi:Pentatricopeptide repeat-containing protein, chloroplastic [Vitis vinifera]|uniref:Pentatricopeptide repeat-containing protein, chloroplastic n=1 Tax=Vitis vinifera TaxID=29760 RepID=A0A438G869_VITVI|nr:Pentatricopeptide repeat-containing protein, chloroplastic [Vitis vinifera]
MRSTHASLNWFSQLWAKTTSSPLKNDVVRAHLHQLHHDEDLYATLLRRFAETRDSQHGRALHAKLIKGPLHNSLFLNNHILNMYANAVTCPMRTSCSIIFRTEMLCRGPSSLRALSSTTGPATRWCYSHKCTLLESISTSLPCFVVGKCQGFGGGLCEGVKPDNFAFSGVLSGLAALGDGGMGVQVHGQLVKCGHGGEVCIGNSLVDMYLKCGSLENGIKAFEEMVERDVCLGIRWLQGA